VEWIIVTLAENQWRAPANMEIKRLIKLKLLAPQVGLIYIELVGKFPGLCHYLF
jgi:hypothetical protein